MKNLSLYLVVGIGILVVGYLVMQPKTNLPQSVVTPSPVASAVVSETIIQIIPSITTPMVWTEPISSTLSDAQGNEILGTLITSKVTSKENNKFAGFLVTDSPLITQYGWKEDPSGMAAGMGETLSTYTKNNQKLIIRYKEGTYKVLLSN